MLEFTCFALKTEWNPGKVLEFMCFVCVEDYDCVSKLLIAFRSVRVNDKGPAPAGIM